MTNHNGHRPPPMTDFRCLTRHGDHVCTRLLFRGVLVTGCHIEIRCPRCGRVSVFEGPPAVVAPVVELEESVEAA